MKKKLLVGIAAGIAVSVACIAVASFIHRSSSGEHLAWQWWVFVPLAVVVLGTCTVLVLDSYNRSKGKNAENKPTSGALPKKYESTSLGRKVVVLIDFPTKQFGSNLIYKQVVPFSRVASGRIEVLPYAASKEKCQVQYVIAISRKDNDLSYDYIEMFSTVVNKSELGENDQLTAEMFDKYPQLSDILALHEDVQKIMEINHADGVAMREATDGEWGEPSETEQVPEDEQPHYTKPPFWNKKW